ncbi:hypothetical protein GCM10027399_02120 [Curvibacter fontanus]
MMQQSQSSDDKSTEPGSDTNQIGIKILAWSFWVIGLIGGGFIVILWFGFGVAAAQGASTTAFIGKTLLAVTISLGGSLYAFLKKYFVVGILLNWAMVPIVFLLDDPMFMLQLFR